MDISYCSFAVQRHHDQSNLKKKSIYLGICLQFQRVNPWPSWWGTRQLAWRHGAGAISEHLHPDTKVECRESETRPDVVLWNLSRNHIQKYEPMETILIQVNTYSNVKWVLLGTIWMLGIEFGSFVRAAIPVLLDKEPPLQSV